MLEMNYTALNKTSRLWWCQSYKMEGKKQQIAGIPEEKTACLNIPTKWAILWNPYNSECIMVWKEGIISLVVYSMDASFQLKHNCLHNMSCFTLKKFPDGIPSDMIKYWMYSFLNLEDRICTYPLQILEKKNFTLKVYLKHNLFYNSLILYFFLTFLEDFWFFNQ